MWGYYHAVAQSPGQHMCGGGGRGGVTTHAAVKLRNAGQLGQAWRYCVVKTFPSPSISFPSAWQHAPRPAPPRLRCAPVHTELGRAVSRVLGRVAWDGKWGQVSPALFQIYSAENAWNVSEHDPLPRWLASLVLVTWPRCNYTGTVTGCRPQSSEERAGAGRRIVTPYNGAFVPPLGYVSSVHTMAVSHVSIFSLVNTDTSHDK